MRRVRYSVAMSLDGYIAGPNGEYDWILMDPEIDFAALASSFDTMLLGRKTYEAALQMGGGPAMPGMQAYVLSRTLRQTVPSTSTAIGDVSRAFDGALTAMAQDLVGWTLAEGQKYDAANPVKTTGR